MSPIPLNEEFFTHICFFKDPGALRALLDLNGIFLKMLDTEKFYEVHLTLVCKRRN
jgi:hypothetical protein